MNEPMGRREFIASLTGHSGTTPGPMTVRMGVHGERVSLLGYGAMRYPTVDGSHANTNRGGSNAPIDLEAVQRQIDYAIAHGVNYFDTSPVYCRGESEKVLGDCLAKHPRDRWLVATKLSNFNAKFHSFEGSRGMYEESFRLLRTDHIDFYLLHAIGGKTKDMTPMELFNARFIDNGMLDFLLKEREAGRIRNLGFSFHGSEAVFRHALAMHDRVHWDFVQIQLNYLDWRNAQEVNPRNVNAETLYALLAERGIPAVVMEPLLGGRLAKPHPALERRMKAFDPSATPAKWAFRFAGSPSGVLTVLSGMTLQTHLEENVSTYSPVKPLSTEETMALARVADEMLHDRTIPCTGCEYCMPCPYGVDIPTLFSFWNDALALDGLPDDPRDPDYSARRAKFLEDYRNLLDPLRRAERCIGCGRCVPHCPQQIEIPEMLRRIDALVERLRRETPPLPVECPVVTMEACNDCGRCHCPYGVDVAGVFAQHLDQRRKLNLPENPADVPRAGARSYLIDLGRRVPALRRADRCVGCWKCVAQCPRRIPIPAEMRRVDAYVDGLRRQVGGFF